MSVTGLDSPAVTEAYQATLADPAGWLLLHYKSREELELLRYGSGGRQELRAALEGYELKSPLYGFFMYRRRKVILKYIPAETSRLLQVRTTVHFPAITDRFTPSDASFSASSPSDLTEAALIATCSLLTETSTAPLEDSSRPHNTAESTAEPEEEPQSSNPEVSMILARLRANKVALAKQQAELVSEVSHVPETVERGEPAYPDKQTLRPISPVSPILSVEERLEERPPSPKEALSVSLPKDSFDQGPSLADGLRQIHPETPLSKREQREGRAKGKAVVHTARAESPHLYPRATRGVGERLRNDFFDRRAKADSVRPDLQYPRKENGSVRNDFFEPSYPRVASPRPGTSDSKYSFLTWKPKVRLFPRPAEGDAGNRPLTENPARQKLPSGLRIALDKTENIPKLAKAEKPPKTGKSHRSGRSRNTSDAASPPLPSETIPTEPSRIAEPASSLNTVPRRKPVPARDNEPESSVQPFSEEVQSIPQREIETNPISAVEPPRTPSPTKKAPVVPEKQKLPPEKQRLLKALQQRKNQNSNPVTEMGNHVNDTGNSRTILDNILDENTQSTDSGVDLEGASTGMKSDKTAIPRSAIEQSLNKEPPIPESAQAGGSLATPGGLNPEQQSPSISASTSPHLAAERTKKRRTLVKPIKTTPVLGEDSDGFASDDSLIEELQNATVHEARRISIPGLNGDGTPLTPVYSASEGKTVLGSPRPLVYRNGSVDNTPLVGPEPKAAEPPSPAPASVNSLTTSPQKRTKPQSGLSRRIKALAELSNQEKLNHSNYMQMSGSGPLLGGSSSYSRDTPPGSSSGKPPSLNNSQNGISSRSLMGSHSLQQLRQQEATSQSVSITARIVPAQRSDSEERVPSRGTVSPELQQSEVTVQHEAPEHSRSQSKTSFLRIERPPSLASRPESRGSSLSSRQKTSGEHGFSFLGLRRGNEQKTPTRSGRSPSISTLETVEEANEDKTEAKSKTSKFFKRVSGFAAAASRKTPGGSSTRSGRDAKSPPSTAHSKPASTSFIVGDLNVQFPDTLLWKRRWVEVDHAGFLILSASQANERGRIPPRRYHMSELRKPALASQDGQELPHSIWIDLANGGTLQFACEDTVGQTQVMRRLSDCHYAWTHNAS